MEKARAFVWIDQRRTTRRSPTAEPSQPAIGVRIYKNRNTKDGSVNRVCLLLNKAFIEAARLRKGDRLSACAYSGVMAVKLDVKKGVAISGAAFSASRENGRPTKAKITPYAAFSASAWPELMEWAADRCGTWVAVYYTGEHWESA